MRTTTPRATTRAMKATGDPLISGISVAPLTVCCCGRSTKVWSHFHWLIQLRLTGCGGGLLNGTGVSSARMKGIVDVREDVAAVRYKQTAQE